MGERKYWKRIIAMLLILTLVFQYGTMRNVSAQPEVRTNAESNITQEETTEEETQDETTKEDSTQEEIKEVATEATTAEEIQEETTKEEPTTEQIKPKKSAAKATEENYEEDNNEVMLLATNKTVDMTDYITSCKILANPNQTGWTDVTELSEGSVEKNADIKVEIYYNPVGVTFSVGDSIAYQLPEGFGISQSSSDKVLNDTNEEVGTYVINTDGTITITFDNESYLSKHNGTLENGDVKFSALFKEEAWGTGGNQEVKFSDKVSVTVPFKTYEDQGKVTIAKSQVGTGINYDSSHQCYYAEYKMIVTALTSNTRAVTNVTVKDVFTQGAEYVDLSDVWSVNESKGEVAQSDEEKTLEWTIDSILPGKSETLTFRVKVKQTASSSISRVIKNKATAYCDGKSIGESKEVTVTQKASLTIAKTSSLYDEENSCVSYTVTVKAPTSNWWTISDVKVIDQGDGDNLKNLYGDYGMINVPEGTSYTVDNTNKVLTWTIGEMKPGDTKVLTYVIYIEPEYFLGEKQIQTSSGDRSWNVDIAYTVKNKATLYVNNQTIDSATAARQIGKKWISKTGSWVSKDEAKFTVQANFTNFTSTNNTGQNKTPNIDGTMIFSDTLSGSDWVYDGAISVTYYEDETKAVKLGSTELTEFDGKTSWEWQAPDSTYYYEFLYNVRLAKTIIGYPSITNTSTLKFVVGEGKSQKEYSYNSIKTISNTSAAYHYAALEKKFVSLDNSTAEWQTSITQSVVAGSIYQDWRNEDNGGKWSFTSEQIKNVQVSGAGEDKDFTVSTIVRGFEITFNEDIKASEENPIIITYQCTLDTDSVQSGKSVTYTNRANLTVDGHKDTTTASYVYTKDQKIDKQAGTYDAKTGTLTWLIKVNGTGSMQGEATVEDELIDGLEYVDAVIESRGSQASDATLTTSVDEEDSKKVLMKVSGLNNTGDQNAYVQIKLTTKITDKNFLLGGGEVEFSNTAVINYNGIKQSSTATQSASYDSLVKEGTYCKTGANANNMEYTITVNPNGFNMLQNDDEVRLEDTMSSNMMLNSDSLKVIDVANNQEIDVKSSLIINENTFSFEVPDDRALTITYTAYVSGELYEDVDVSNSISYYGTGVTNSSTKETHIEIASSASISATLYFYIKKINGVDMSSALSGAQYQLYTVDKTTGELSESPIATQTSDSDGKIKFDNLEESTVYAFKESQAPEKYYIDEENAEPSYVAFKHSAVTQAMKDKGLNVTIIQKGATFQRYNYKGEITVTKSFEGTEIADGLYYFGLFDENDNLVTLEGTKAIKSIKVSDGKLPTYSSVTFKGVDFGTYSVYETTKDGTPVTKDAQGIAVINGNKYTITGDSKGNATVSKTVPKKSITITNTYKPLTVTLKATKVLEDSRQMQTFSFMLRGNNVKDKQSNDSNGKIEFSTLTFTRKDVGTHTYTVKEVIPSGVDDNNFKDGVIYDTKEYQVVIEVTQNNEIGLTATVTVDGTKVEGTNGVYELPKQKGKASFINRYIPKTLTLSKKLYKNLGNMSQKFHFTLTLKLNGTTNPIPDGEYEVQSSVLSGATANSPNISTITFKNGVATVDLSHGQSITIKGLPNNYVIDSIVEDTTKGYEAIITAPDGAIINDTQQMIQLKDSNKIDESIEILYTNKYVEVPPEGVRNEVLPSVIAVVTGISVLGLLLLYRRKRRKRE